MKAWIRQTLRGAAVIVLVVYVVVSIVIPFYDARQALKVQPFWDWFWTGGWIVPSPLWPFLRPQLALILGLAVLANALYWWIAFTLGRVAASHSRRGMRIGLSILIVPLVVMTVWSIWDGHDSLTGAMSTLQIASGCYGLYVGHVTRQRLVRIIPGKAAS